MQSFFTMCRLPLGCRKRLALACLLVLLAAYPAINGDRTGIRAVGPPLAARDAGRSAVLGTITLAASPVDLEVYDRGRRVFVVTQDASTNQISVVMLDARTGTMLRTVSLASVSYPSLDYFGTVHFIATDAATARVFVQVIDAIGHLGTVDMFDAVTGRLLRAVASGPGPSGIFVDTHLGRVYVPMAEETATQQTRNPRVLILDAATGRMRQIVRGVYVGGVMVADESSDRLFMVGPLGIVVLNAATGAVLRTVHPRSYGCSLSVDALAGRVVASNSAGRFSSTLSFLDATTGAVRQELTVNISSGTCPTLADEATGHTFMSTTGPYDTLGYSIMTLDTRTGQYLQGVNVPAPALQNVAMHLAIDARTSRVFVAASDQGTFNDVLVLDAHSGRLLATIPVGTGPLQVAVCEATGRVFVASAGDDTISVLDATMGRGLAPEGRLPVDPVPAAPGSRYFPRTGHNLSGPFLAFWNKYGGVDTFGYPRTEPFSETGHLAQYTDRFLLQMVHNQMQTGPLGRLLTADRSFPPLKLFTSTTTRLYFPATGHSLSGRFLTWWRTHHGAVLLGKPISEVIVEGNGDGSGRRYPLQWFENGRLEYHPEFAGTRYAMELGLLGVQALQQRGWLP